MRKSMPMSNCKECDIKEWEIPMINCVLHVISQHGVYYTFRINKYFLANNMEALWHKYMMPAEYLSVVFLKE